jgi:hypothetical protein
MNAVELAIVTSGTGTGSIYLVLAARYARRVLPDVRTWVHNGSEYGSFQRDAFVSFLLAFAAGLLWIVILPADAFRRWMTAPLVEREKAVVQARADLDAWTERLRDAAPDTGAQERAMMTQLVALSQARLNELTRGTPWLT